ncbi:MAG: hypothetical protein LIO91_08080 [Bacteroidales bacterium]|nr:hypothetical protein [Bacteroidales bacterium]
MAKIRTCTSAQLSTGGSACQLDPGHVIMALLVAHGVKLPADLTGEALEAACHADRPDRVMPISRFVEYSKNGGEPNVSATGYGPNQMTDVSTRTDTFTLLKYSEQLNASLLKCANTLYDVYYIDDKGYIFGIDDGTDTLAGFPMSTVYPIVTPHPTGSDKATETVNFAFVDARAAMESLNYEALDFNPDLYAYGLVPVKFVKNGSNWKLIEAIGGYDRTAEFGAILATKTTSVLHSDITAVTYNEATEDLTVTFKSSPSISVPELLAPSKLYTNGIKGIEQA